MMDVLSAQSCQGKIGKNEDESIDVSKKMLNCILKGVNLVGLFERASFSTLLLAYVLVDRDRELLSAFHHSFFTQACN